MHKTGQLVVASGGSLWPPGLHSSVVSTEKSPQIQGVRNYSRAWWSRQKTGEDTEHTPEGGGRCLPKNALFQTEIRPGRNTVLGYLPALLGCFWHLGKANLSPIPTWWEVGGSRAHVTSPEARCLGGREASSGAPVGEGQMSASPGHCCGHETSEMYFVPIATHVGPSGGLQWTC